MCLLVCVSYACNAHGGQRKNSDLLALELHTQVVRQVLWTELCSSARVFLTSNPSVWPLMSSPLTSLGRNSVLRHLESSEIYVDLKASHRNPASLQTRPPCHDAAPLTSDTSVADDSEQISGWHVSYDLKAWRSKMSWNLSWFQICQD